MNIPDTLQHAAIAASLVVAAAGLTFASGQARAQYTMKIAHAAPQGDPRDTAARHVAQTLNQSSMCKMQARVYPAGQLGSTTDLIEGMQLGSLEAVVLPGSFLVGFQPMMGLMDFPYFWPSDVDKLLAIHQSDAVRRMLDSTDSQGVRSLAIWHTGYKQWTANSPLAQPADYQGKKARAMPSPSLVTQQRALGLIPVDMPFGETYNALQSGAIYAQENPISTSYVMRFHEVQSHLTLTSHGTLDQVFMVSKAWFNALPSACQQDILRAVDEGRALVVRETLRLDEQGLNAMRKSGVTVIQPNEEQRRMLRDATLPAVRAQFEQRTGIYGRDVMQAIEAEIQRQG